MRSALFEPFSKKTSYTRRSKTSFLKAAPLNRRMGNQAYQAKLKVGSAQDRYEYQADAMADRVLKMRSDQTLEMSNDLDSAAMDKPLIQRKAKNSTGSNQLISKVGEGRPLEPSVRSYMEPRFGRDFSQVRVYTDEKAGQAAHVIQARAFTMGRDIVFGRSEYNPSGNEGKRLLAHELAHVVQQENGLQPSIQKQEIPLELQTSVDHTTLSDEELQHRYDLIVTTLWGFDYSTDETVLLEEEAGQIGIEFARREAIASGRTFTPESIERMRTFFIGNATSASPLNCIACMNRGLRTLLNDLSQAMGSEVQTTMARLERDGRASAPHVIEFNDSAGRMTTGVRRPDTLSENVVDEMLRMAGNDVGWSVFGMSLMDGYHSVTLTLDNNDPANPRIFWSDQWSSRGGWQEFNRTTLNAEITRVIQGWWDGQPAGRKSRTRVTLWRLNQ